jgi:hypothetical protein
MPPRRVDRLSEKERMRLAVNRPGSVALLLALALPVGGCDRVFGLDRVTVPPLAADNGYTCDCECTFPGEGTSLLSLDVCVPPELNPNVAGGEFPSSDELRGDCADRVESQIEEMSDECFAGQDPVCDCVTSSPLPTTFYDESCDAGCPAVPIDDACTNWDPEAGNTSATCADPVDCDDFGPVCLKQGVNGAGPQSVSAALMGRTTTCQITDGDLSVSADDHSASSGMAGVVRFTPAPVGTCAPGEACVTMEYRLDATQTLHFDGFLGFGDTDLSDITTSGASQAFALDSTSAAFVPQDGTRTSGRGFENGTRRALFGSNGEELFVSFDGETCAVDGAVVGGVGDPDGDNADGTVTVDVFGDVVNAPPIASFGADRTMECTSPEGAAVALDASASFDREDNIVSRGWYLGSRAGPALGVGAQITVQQALGAQTYVLKTIDGGMQADEASATVTVVDTVAPVVDCDTPASVTPSGAPYTFTATASDVCDAAQAAPEVLDFECFTIKASGTRVDHPCHVDVDSGTVTIRNTGGVGSRLRWHLSATDADGNETVSTCETVVVPLGAP